MDEAVADVGRLPASTQLNVGTAAPGCPPSEVRRRLLCGGDTVVRQPPTAEIRATREQARAPSPYLETSKSEVCSEETGKQVSLS